MSKWDEVDPQRARRYAWAHPEDGLSVELETPDGEALAPGGEGDDEDSARDLAEWRGQAKESCAKLAAAIDRVWQAAGEEQARLTPPLFESVRALGPSLVALRRHPLQSLRLVRLVLRHWNALSAEAHEGVGAALIWLHLDQPELADLLVEVARAGLRPLSQALIFPLCMRDESFTARRLRRTDLAERLLDLLRSKGEPGSPPPQGSAPSPLPPLSGTSCRIALDWLGLVATRGAIPTLRTVLRRPHFGVRERALDLLMSCYRPPAIEAEDVLFLLSDLFIHPPPAEAYDPWEEPTRFAANLERALTAVRPEGGAELLERLARGEGPRALKYTATDGRWALRVLAAAYPERALPLVDEELRSCSAWRRTEAVAAAARLPEELARTRLLTASGDGAPQVAEAGREQWLARFGTSCPTPPLFGFPVELLPVPPDEAATARLLGRLAALRGPSIEARQAMLEVLLKEAPDREALALITFALADDGLLRTRHRARLPRDLSQLCGRLYRGFGQPALLALCWLAERYPGSGATSWLYELGFLASRGRLRKRDLGPVRSLAGRRVGSLQIAERQQALAVLARIGGSPELLDSVYAVLLAAGPEARDAAEVIAGWPADPALDARLVADARRAWARREVQRLCGLFEVGAIRRIPAFGELAQQGAAAWLDGASDSEGSWRRLAVLCARHLEELSLLPASFVRDGLADPASPAFELAADLLLRELDTVDSSAVDGAGPGEPIRKALRTALASPARSGESACAAALVLLRLGELGTEDARVQELAAGAAEQSGAFVLLMKVLRHEPLDLVLPLLEEVLRRGKVREREGLILYVTAHFRILPPEAARSFVPRVQDPQLRAALAAIGEPRHGRTGYWEDEEQQAPRP